MGRYRIYTADTVPLPSSLDKPIYWLGETESLHQNSYCNAADKILRGRMDIFDLIDHNLGHPPKWNCDPLTGKVAPLIFGKAIDYRNESLVGNIKYLWEPNRHLQLVTLAQAYYLSNSDKYLYGLKEQLDSWFDECPYLQGPQWTSSLELGIRLINWCIVWQLIGGHKSPLFSGEEGKRFLGRWLDSIYQHVHFIQGYYSKYSSANNHLIGEAAGIFVATTTWPFWPRFMHWNKKAKEILEREILLQNTIDGVNREQAIAYQQFVLDFALFSMLAARENNIHFSNSYYKRIESMLEYLASIMDVAGNVPMIGDADDGFVVSLSKEDGWCPYKSLLATGAVLYSRKEFKVKAEKFDDKSKWLLGEQGSMQFQNICTDNAVLPVRREYREGGYYILGSAFESEKEVRVVADAGALGYRSIAAHGHADALSFTLSIGGNEILVDTGTYTYHTQKYWRNYFRGTAAHNALRIDQCDQSEIGGNFMWLRKACAECNSWITGEDEDVLIASHDGYVRLPDPVTHNRTIRFLKPNEKLVITDSLVCQDSHMVELFWHFSEQCLVEVDCECVIIRVGSVLVTMRLLNHHLVPQLFYGHRDPSAGWISRKFGVKKPIYTALWSKHIKANTEFITELVITFDADPSIVTDFSDVEIYS